MALPSRKEWLVAARRVGVLSAAVLAWFGVRRVGEAVAHWLYNRHGWHGAFGFWWHVVHTTQVAMFLAVAAGLAWTAGTLVVASIAAARRPFRSIGESVSRVAARFPRLTRHALPWLPGLIASRVGTIIADFNPDFRVGHFVGVAVVFLTSYAVCRGFAARLATGSMADAFRVGARMTETSPEVPRERPTEPAAATGATPFAAIAVTPLTRAIVGATVLSSVGMLLAGLLLPTGWSVQTTLGLFIAYGAILLAMPLVLRRSRIVAGADGVLVLGAGAPRFHAYADHDEVRQDGDDILLVRRGKVQLRLQLDDADLARAPELALRLGTAMSVAATMRQNGADDGARALLDQKDGSERLASSASGARDYRKPAVVREHLWELVQGPLCDGETRMLVAEALAHDLRDDERPRLRVAAMACAEPRVRLALEKLAGEPGGEPENEVAFEDESDDAAAPATAIRVNAVR